MYYIVDVKYWKIVEKYNRVHSFFRLLSEKEFMILDDEKEGHRKDIEELIAKGCPKTAADAFDEFGDFSRKGECEDNPVKKIYDELWETYKRKNADYGNSFDISLQKFGIITALTRISDKYNRAENLILKGANNGPLVADEKVEDTLLDMANYCVMTAAFLRGKQE